MSEPLHLVLDFIGGEHTAEGLAAAVEKYCADDCRWENTGMPTIEGKEQMLGMLGGMGTLGIASMKVDVRHIAQTEDGAVLTERQDDIYRPDGSLLLSLMIMGIFEVRDGKITAWRDYFNPVLYMQAVMGQA